MKYGIFLMDCNCRHAPADKRGYLMKFGTLCERKEIDEVLRDC